MNTMTLPSHQYFTDEEEKRIADAYQELVNSYMMSKHRQKLDVISRAFRLAYHAHGDVRRKSGEPYILHPLAVALIVSKEIGLGSTSIACALLHDVVEDTYYTVEDLRAEFGDSVARIVNGVTKRMDSKTGSKQIDNIQHLLKEATIDMRVLFIKMADRLHNMRTLGAMMEHKQHKITAETSMFYATLANRTGMFALKNEFEELCFQLQYPQEYEEIGRKLEASVVDRNDLITNFLAPIIQKLDERGYKYEVLSRIKTRHSIWKKMKKQNIAFEDVYDLFATRIILDDVPEAKEWKECRDVSEIVRSLYRFKENRERDYIRNPKDNGYQSIHCTAMSMMGRWVEVQIRTRRMDDIAERGFAAHWMYKCGAVSEEDPEVKRFLDEIRSILESEVSNEETFEQMHQMWLGDKITVFTPRGEQRSLPKGATALDFAYLLHTEIGNKAMSAQIAGHAYPLHYVLRDSDQVEIIYSNSEDQVKPEWINYAYTTGTKNAVRKALREQRKRHVNLGEQELVAYLTAQGIKFEASLIDRVLSLYKLRTKEDLYEKVALRQIDLEQILEVCKTKEKKGGGIAWFKKLLGRGAGDSQSSSSSLEQSNSVGQAIGGRIDRKKIYTLEVVDGVANYKRAKCCSPIPQERVVGIVERETEVVIHELSCPVGEQKRSVNGDDLLATQWGNQADTRFAVPISLQGIDQPGLVSDLTQSILIGLGTPFTEISFTASGGIFKGQITLQVHNLEELNRIINKLREHKAVTVIGRLEK